MTDPHANDLVVYQHTIDNHLEFLKIIDGYLQKSDLEPNPKLIREMLTVQLCMVEAMNVLLSREIMKSSPKLTPMPRSELDDQNTQRRVQDIISQ